MKYWYLCFMLLTFSSLITAQPELDLHAEAAVLIEQTTGQVLYNKNGSEVIPPASLTKLMTLHLAFEALDKGLFTKSSIMNISERAYYQNQSWGSSVMGLEEGMTVTFEDLLLGLAISSGNDGAVAIAENVSGSVEAFVKRMNEEAKTIGLTETHFVDPAGVEGDNKTTALDFALFCRYYINHHPKALQELHSVRTFDFPRPENGGVSKGRWRQLFINRNRLLRDYEFADGLKTGYIHESGYNLASTAEKDHMRLIAVLLGIQSRSGYEGSRMRTGDAIQLFDYGFDHYSLLVPAHASDLNNLTISLWPAHQKKITVRPQGNVTFLLPKEEQNEVFFTVNLHPYAASLSLEKPVGFATLHEGNNVHKVPLYADDATPAPRWFTNLNARFTLFIKSLFNRKQGV